MIEEYIGRENVAYMWQLAGVQAAIPVKNVY
jgi:hypothetical protein